MTITRATLLAFLFGMLINASIAQDKMGYSLKVASFSSQRDQALLQPASQPLRFTWTVEPKNFLFEGTIPGRLIVVASADSLLSQDDPVLLDSLCTLPQFSFDKKSLKHSLSGGLYYLFSTYSAIDTAKFESKSNTVVTRAHLFDINATLISGWFSHLKVSEYNEETTVNVKVDLLLSCCAAQLGSFNSQWEIGLSKDASSDGKVIQTFYRTDTLMPNSNQLELTDKIYNTPDFNKFKFMTVKMTSAYFSEGYLRIPDILLVIPLKVITNAGQLNARRRDQYPFLTYDNFEIPKEKIPLLAVDSLYKEAKIFYGLSNATLQSIKDNNVEQAIQIADSAFAFVGSHPESSLLYVEPSIVSDLYAGLIRWRQHYAPMDNQEQSALNFRLGEAMKMEDLMENAYGKLVNNIFPDSLARINELEESGFFSHEDVFRQPAITDVPVLWRDGTIPALEHFVRILDFESADQIVTNANEHLGLVQPLWTLLAGDTILFNQFTYLANDISENNEMLDFTLARLNFYTQSGLYVEGDEAVEEAAKSYAMGYQNAPALLWMAAGNFYESMGAYNRADSLYKLVDDHYEKEIRSTHRNNSLDRLLRLKSRNKELLQAKLQAVEPSSGIGNAITNELEKVGKDNKAIFSYMDLLSDHTLAQKLGFFGSPIYAGFYLNQMNQLTSQGEYFQANKWATELAFFLGRDGHKKEALALYENSFTVENLQALAFRLSFSEEEQIFYGQKQLATFGRYLDLLANYKKVATPAAYDSAITNALQQALFQHAFILRGNFSLLDDVYRSDDLQVQKLFTLWQTWREYLNKLYVRDEPDTHGLQLVKKEILATEKKLVRLARDTSSVAYDYIPKVDSIRNKLKVNEAAVEFIRYHKNHEIYYGKEVAYAAMIVKKSDPVTLITFPETGELMETDDYKFYRNAIRFKIQDNKSYGIYWKPLQTALEGITKVFWAPDGIFHLINPNTLFDPITKKYVLEDYTINMVPTIAQIKDSFPIEISSATILGNPWYHEFEGRANDSVSTRKTREFLTRGPINFLPGTKTEAETIASQLRVADAKVVLLTDKKASKSSLFKNNGADVLHLATHGFWIDNQGKASGYHSIFEAMSHSGLILAGAQKLEKEKYTIQPEGILTSAEIQDMNLFHTKLVVLSACETGLGEIVPGEGLYGLKRAFQKAGVQHLITSLWKVDDTATMEFMTTFYQQLLKTGDLSSSFRHAMLSLREKFPEPYYWGAFVLTDN